MRMLILAVGVLLSFNQVHAQYENLVETKLASLGALENKVETSTDLSATDRSWAMQQIEESRLILIEASQGELAELQQAELKINGTCKKVAGRLLMLKKAKLANRISTLDTMIKQYQSEGLDTASLEALSEAMSMHMAKLES